MTIEWSDLRSGVVCSCEYPRFQGDGACKHIWASLIFADTHDLLRDKEIPESVKVLEDDGYDDQGGGDDDPAEDDNDDPGPVSHRRVAETALVKVRSLKTRAKPPAAPTNWQRALPPQHIGSGQGRPAPGWRRLQSADEGQAIDRAHRIGQEKPVFAYRLIARDTVEEKILELQSRKRELADVIISADASLLQNLTAEDLQLLLSPGRSRRGAETQRKEWTG